MQGREIDGFTTVLLAPATWRQDKQCMKEKTMRNPLLTLFFGVVTLLAFAFLPILGYPAAIVTIIFLVLTLRQNRKEQREANQEIKRTDSQLRTELNDIHLRALSELSGASVDLKEQVIKLLVEAGKHLGEAPEYGLRVYGPGHTINWNREGLSLVAEARALIDEYVARAEQAV
jgi:hypothetical protein